MIRVLSIAVVTMFVGALLTPALAEDRPTPIAPPKTTGDEGKLPLTAKRCRSRDGGDGPRSDWRTKEDGRSSKARFPRQRA
jgi:hypothetical protein